MCERFLIQLIQLWTYFSLDTGEINTLNLDTRHETRNTENTHFLHCPLRDLCKVKDKDKLVIGRLLTR